jgi:hypothetical protein
MRTIKDLENIESALAAYKATRAMRALQIELGMWETSDERRRAMAALAEYDECVALLEADCESVRQSLNALPAVGVMHPSRATKRGGLQ